MRSLLRGTRSFIVLALVSVVLLTGTMLFVTLPSLGRALETRLLEERLLAEARLVAVSARPVVESGDLSELPRVLENAEDATQVRVALVTAMGTRLGNPAAVPADMAPDGRDALPPIMRWDPGVGGDVLFVSVPVDEDASRLGVVYVAKPLSGLGASLPAILRALALPLALALAVAVGAGLWLGSRIRRPILSLTKFANEVAMGRYDREVRVGGAAELVELGNALGRMAKALNSSFASLEAQRDRLDAVLEHMADGILIANADGIVTLANEAAGRILGTDPAKAIGQRLAAVVREHEIVGAARRSLTSTGGRGEFAATVERASPRRYLRAVATRIGDGRDAQVLVVLQDLTALRRLETVRRDFFANVSHELRTPIAAIKAMVETLEDGAIDDPPAARDFLGRVHRETDGLSHLVEELLQLSRIESGQFELRLEPIEPSELIDRVVERLSPLAERAGVSLETNHAADLPPVWADRERIAQVLANIVHNAIKFTPPGGTVTVGATHRQRGVALWVTDTGVGIAETDISRLFERFYKVDKARATGGTGLGLAIAKHLVQAHGGEIWAESPGPGQGSTFVFTIPIA